MKQVRVNIPGTPPKGKKSGYRSMDEAREPGLLPQGVMAQIQGLNPAKGRLDGTMVGTGEALNTVAMPRIYDPLHWSSQTGKNYILGYTDDGRIAYTENDWSDWDGTRFVKLESGSDLIFETSDGSTLRSGAPHVKVAFCPINNVEVVCSNGIDDVYTIDGRQIFGFLMATLLKSDAAATVMENANFPPYLSMIYLGGRSIIHDGEVARVSSPNDDKRFYSTIEERNGNVWDDNDWVAPAAPGESSYITSRFIHVGGLECLITTNNGVYWIGLEPDPRFNNIPRLNILPLLVGAGCPTGACYWKLSTFFFLSDFNGGSWLAMRKAATSSGDFGERIELEAKNGWVVREVAAGIAPSLKLIKDSDFKLISDVIETRNDWERVKDGQRKNIDCITSPGSIFINAKSKMAFTFGDIIITDKDSSVRDAQPGTTQAITASWDTTYPATKAYDNDPNYALGEKAYTVSTDYALLKISTLPGWSMELSGPTVRLLQPMANKLTKELAAFYRVTGTNDIWSNYVPKEIVKNVSMLYLSVSVSCFSGLSNSVRSTQYVVIPIIFSEPINLSGFHIFDLRWDPTAKTVRFGEVFVEGVGETSATYISDIRTISNLTAQASPSNFEFARLTAMFRKVSKANYPKIYIRGGSSSTMDSVLSTTLTTATEIGDTSVVLASVSGIQVGDVLTLGVDSPKVESITGLEVFLCETLTVASNIGTAVTVRGSSSTTPTWSNWTELTLYELYRGYKLADLVKMGTSDPVLPDSNGNFYWQFKVGLEIDPITGLSPVLFRLRPGFMKGTLPLSNHFMSGALDDSLILCCPETDSSSENDITFVLNVLLGPWKLAGQHIDSIVQVGKDFIVSAGKKMAKLWTGNYNYIYADGATKDTPLLRKLISNKTEGKALSIIGQQVLIQEFTPKTLDLTTLSEGDGGEDTDTEWPVFVRGVQSYVGHTDEELKSVYTVPARVAPVLKDTASPAAACFKPYISGAYLYLPTTVGLEIYDISDKDAPDLVGSMTYANNLVAVWAHVFVSGNYAYIAYQGTYGSTHNTRLDKVDISDKTAPAVDSYFRTVLVSAPTSRAGCDNYNDTNVIFARGSVHNVLMSDMSQNGTADIGAVAAIVTSGGDIVVACGADGIKTMNYAATPTVRASLDTPGTAVALAQSGNHIFVADTDSIQVVDISDLDTPEIVDTFTISALDVAVLGNYLYVAGTAGMTVLDITDPTNISEVSSYTALLMRGITSIYKDK